MGKVRDRLKSFLRRETGQAPVWIEVREASRNDGDHVHLALYVPPHLIARFRRSMLGWVNLDADTIERRAVKVVGVFDWVGLQRYLLKGAAQEVRQLFFVPLRHNPFQGVVYGPRVRVSHSIGPTARNAAATNGCFPRR
jgi:hypothetical protein